jgi:SAM-dependent methyltransferase
LSPAVATYRLASRVHWKPRERTILAALDRLAGERAGNPARLVDVGCGPGLLCAPTLRRGLRYLGVDSDPAFVAYCRSAFRDPAASFLAGDASRCVAGCGPRDVVVMNGVLHHLDDAEARTLVAASRVARAVIVADHLRADEPPRWLVRTLQDHDRGRHVRAHRAIEGMFGRPPIQSVRYPIKVAGITLWEYFTDTYLGDRDA